LYDAIPDCGNGQWATVVRAALDASATADTAPPATPRPTHPTAGSLRTSGLRPGWSGQCRAHHHCDGRDPRTP
jgi:hypothetical protein